MKYWLLLGFLIIFNGAYGQTLEVKVNPRDPVYNEPFTLEFVLKTSEELEEEPFISFDPMNAEVVSKSDVSTSTQFSYVNGQSSVQRTYSFSYDLIAPRPGSAYIRSIVAEVNGKKIRHKTIQISVQKSQRTLSKIFVRAEVDKEEVYVGESILVRYYVYSRNDVPVRSFDIKKFPKLDKFLKRFHQEQTSPERVNYRGQLFVRRIMYTAQLFADKTGVFKIDPITMSVKYTNRNNSFGGFGLGLQFGKTMSTTIVSKPVEINVIPLPVQGMPKSFSGLVGHHEAELKINKNKFIANEPIEINFSIKGNGAMEMYEAPSLLNNSTLEEFEKNSDLSINADFTSVKKIKYTYLGRESLNLENQIFEFSYFDPELKEYKTIKLPIGTIKVAGGLNNRRSKDTSVKDKNQKEESVIKNYKEAEEFEFKPIFKLLNTFLYTIEEIFVLTILILVGLLTFIFYRTYKSFGPRDMSLFDEMKKNGANFSHLHQIFKSSDNQSLVEKIQDSRLNDEIKSDLLSVVDRLQNQYKSGGQIEKVKFDRKTLLHLKKLHD